MKPSPPARRVSVAGVLTAALCLAIAAPPVASQLPSAADLECEAAERRSTLQEEQASVLRMVGELEVLRSSDDLDALAERGYSSRPHQFTSIRGIGVAMVNPAAPTQPGSPNVLLYAPDEDAGDVTDPRGPDYPYTLVGWAYQVGYAPGHLPSFLPCVGQGDWLIHERGIHAYETGEMIPMPPAEPSIGAAVGSLNEPPALRPVVGYPHPREWVAHFWREQGGVPSTGILDPTDPPDGIDPGEGSSLYFPDGPVQGALEPTAGIVQPSVLQDGEGLAEASRNGNTFVLKVGAGQTLGAFSLFDATLEQSGPATSIEHSEGWYVLDGEVTFEADGQALPAERGSFVYLPPGVERSFRVGQDGARAMLVTAPGGLERELGIEAPGPSAGDPQGPGGQGPRGGSQERSLSPYVLRPGEGEVVNVRSGVYTLKASQEDTGGGLSVMEIELPRGSEAPPHIHHVEAEAFYLLEGEVTFQVNGLAIPARTGDLAYLPRTLPHFYGIDGHPAVARLLLFTAPSGLEGLFRVLDEVGNRQPTVEEVQPFGVEPLQPPPGGGGAPPGAGPPGGGGGAPPGDGAQGGGGPPGN